MPTLRIIYSPCDGKHYNKSSIGPNRSCAFGGGKKNSTKSFTSFANAALGLKGTVPLGLVKNALAFFFRWHDDNDDDDDDDGDDDVMMMMMMM